MLRYFFPPSLRFATFSVGFLSCLGSVPAFAQTIEEGLDHPLTLTPLTTESELLDETDFPAGEWSYTTGITHDGVDAIRSTLPKGTTSRLDTTVQGPATVSFWWKVDGGNTTGFDKLYFSSRNDYTFINGNTDWQERTFEVDTGSQPLIWFFERLPSDPMDTAEALLDQLVVTPIPNNALLQEAVENTTYSLHSTDWTPAPLAGAVNSTVAKSGEVAIGEISTMMFEIEGPATVKFHWGIAADESDESRLVIRVNNQIATDITGPTVLEDKEETLDLGPGTHAMKFTFERGASSNPEYTGPVEGYIDQLIVTEIDAEDVLADAVEREGGVYSNTWTSQSLVTFDGVDAIMVMAPEISKTRRIYVELPDEPGLFSFWYKMDADPNSGYLIALLDGMQILNRNGVSGWTKVELNLDQGSDRVFQAIFIRYSDPSGNSPNTKVYLDQISFTPGGTNYQPDLSIGTLAKKNRLKGVGVYNSSGAGQISTIRAPRTRPVGEYVIRAQNGSGTDSDKISLRGVGSRKHYKIYYVVEEDGQKLNYSAAFAAGMFETTNLSPKGSEGHEIWIVRKRKAFKKRSHILRVIGTSEADPRKIDVIRTKLIVKNR